jgi:hypothetical protein
MRTPRPIALLAATIAATAVDANEVRNPNIAANGTFMLQFGGVQGRYAILVRGSAVTAIEQAVALTQDTSESVTLADPNPAGDSPARFYRVQWVPVELPRDVDGDGMSDVFELKYPAILSPLDARDRDLDPDGDGRPNITESMAGTDPSVKDFTLTRVETSPIQGASGISVRRETIFRLSQPLEAAATLLADVVYAEVGARRILSRAELSSDRRKITLFYREPLPASARVRVRLDGNRLRDEAGSLVDGDGDGQPGGWTEIEFDTMSSALLAGTAVSGFVYDSAPQQTPNGPVNKPVVGAIVSIDGNEQTGRAVTDANGFFLLNPCPAGRFFVHIDGHPADGSDWPEGAYYPEVGKTFEGTVGRTNLAPGNGIIFLPLVAAGTLRTVSAGTTTTVEFPATVLAARPELNGVKIMVPPNSLFADDGARGGGSVGIAPVPPDRLPAPLPPGLEPAIVITVQTDGASNFDQPVPVQFPNLPDPKTGAVLGPGERSVLWSFNHDSGQWEPQGTMTVSADGKFLVSDPGVGILQPGWHGASAVGQPTPPPNNCPVAQLAQEYLEAQLKQAECMMRMAAILLLKGPLTVAQLQSTAMLHGASSLPGFMTSMIQNLSNLSSAVQAGQPANAVGAIAGIIGANMAAITQATSILFAKGSTPLKADLLVCLLELAKEQLDFTCGVVPCLFSNHPNFAQQMAFCNQMQTAVQTALNAVNAYQFKQGGAYTRLTVALQNLTQLIAAYPGGGSGSIIAGPDTARAQLAAASLADQIQAQITEALAALEELQRELQPTVDLANQLSDTVNTYSNVLAAIHGPALLRLNGHANGYYKMTSGTFVSRGRTTASGALDLPMISLFEGYSLLIYDPLRNAVSEGVAPAPGFAARPILPDPILRLPGINDLSGDTDEDGLTDLAEDVIGTRRDQKDTDADGASDYVEVQQGRDPLSGIALPVGPVSALPLSGLSKSIALDGTVAYLAQGTGGMAVADLSDPLNPILLSQTALPGDSYDIAHSPTARTAAFVAYASDAQISQGELAQVHFVDVTDPTQPRLFRNFLIGASLIEESDGIYYVGIAEQVRMYDALSGLEIGWFAVEDRASGILPTQSEIFVTTPRKLFIYERALSSPVLKGSVSGDFAAADFQSKVHMVLDGTRLWVGTARGLLAVDISDRAAPRVLNAAGASPRAFRTLHLSAAKRAIALTTLAANAIVLGGQTSVFDVSDPGSTNRLNLILNARGRTYDSALMSGWLVLADGQAGLTVFNLLQPDLGGQAPAIDWRLDAHDVDAVKLGIQMVEGQHATFRATITDDVEVDFSELLIDGAIVGVSRVIPPVFEYQLPTLASGAMQLEAQIRSRDRSGNSMLSGTVVIELVPDATPPAVISPTSQSGIAAFSNSPLVLRFTEHVLPQAWQAPGIALLSFGPDGAAGSGDDVVLPIASVSVVGASTAIVPSAPLTSGRYRLTIPKEQIRDFASNAPPADLVLEFVAFETDPSTAVWISPAPGRYHDPANWLHRRVPGQEHVVIQLPQATPTVTLDSGAVVKEFTAAGGFTLSGRFAGLTVRYSGLFKGPVQCTGSASISLLSAARFEADLVLRGSELSTAGLLETLGKTTVTSSSVSLSGPDARWLRPGGIETSTASFEARDGAIAEFGEFTTFESPGDFSGLFPLGSRLTAFGFGSKLVLPNLVSGVGPTETRFTGAPSLEFAALSGGVIEMPKLESLTGRVRLSADGQGSRLEAPQLASVQGPESFASLISAFNFSEIRAPSLALLKKSDVRLADATLHVSQLQIESANSLSGYGTIAGNVHVQGNLLLDFAGGSLVVNGSLSLAPGATFSPALGQTFGPAVLEVRDQALLDGILKPTLARGFTPATGAEFIVGKFPGGVSGNFSQLDPSALGAGAAFEAPLSASDLTVRITAP